MHELGVLRQVVKTVDDVAKKNKIKIIRHITLEVGTESGYVPYYIHKLFPVALKFCPELGSPQLKLEEVAGKGLRIKDIGYQDGK